jgi:cytoskeletal protein RodZ
MPDQEPQPHSELASFGEELRREREIRGISLKEIADATKISKRFLEAIERNDHKTLPAPVFTRGFVREYARYLGLNAEEMVNRYNYAAAGDDRIEKSAHLERLVAPAAPALPREKPKKPSGIPPAYARIDRNLIYIIIIVSLLVGVFYWARKYKREEAAREAATIAAVKPPVVKPPIAPAPKPPVTATTSTAPDDRVLHLTFELNDDSWVQVKADGKTVWSDDLQRGQTKTFDANEVFVVTIGNAAGVTLTLNGVKLPPLGGPDKIVHRTFDRDFLQRARTAAQESQGTT